MDIKSLLIEAFLVDETTRALSGLHEARRHVAGQTTQRPVHIDVVVPKVPDDDWLRARVIDHLAQSHATFVSFRYCGCIWCVMASDVIDWAARSLEPLAPPMHCAAACATTSS